MALKQAISACHALPAVAGVLPGIKKERVKLWSDLLHKCSAWSLICGTLKGNDKNNGLTITWVWYSETPI